MEENKHENEEFEITNEETELLEELVGAGFSYYKKVKRRLIIRGFVIGVLSAISIQSIITILVLMN